MNEKEVIEGCIKGNERDFKTFYSHFYGKMFHACVRYAKDREEAKDIVQEGFLRVFKNLDQFDFKGSLEGWVRRVMVNSAINHYRKQMKDIINYMEDDKVVYLEKHEEESYESPENISSEQLLAMVQSLTPVYRTVFNLSVMEGFSHKEISESLGITESTSRSNLAKARIKLQEMVNKQLVKINTHEAHGK
ncbi:MAG: RNA polymerase sigma factor [Bacteroidetes bacterium]|nr:RNA polymerase sigma factor [Bacteroidota bacterium]